MKERGYSRFTKDVDPVLSSDTGVTVPALDAGFIGQESRQSVLGKLLGLGAQSFTLGRAMRLQVGRLTAATVEEGATKPVGRIDFELAGAPTKVAAAIVVSQEAVQSFGAATSDGITNALISASAAAVDVALVQVLTAGSPVGSASVADVFAACADGAPSRPVLISSLGTMLALPTGTIRDLQAMGVAVVTTPAAQGWLIGLDASGLAISDAGVSVQTAMHADILMDDGGSPPSSTVVSLWQLNLACLRAERFIRLALRQGACAFASTGSPA